MFAYNYYTIFKPVKVFDQYSHFVLCFICLQVRTVEEKLVTTVRADKNVSDEDLCVWVVHRLFCDSWASGKRFKISESMVYMYSWS